MTNFVPINDDHAVSSVLFGVQLDEFIEPQVIAALKAESPWKLELPALLDLPTVDIEASGQSHSVPALQFAIVRPDSRPLWSLRFRGFDLVVECTAYSRWDEVWITASKFLEEAFAFIKQHQPDLHILDFRLQVTDQFTTSEKSMDFSELFKKGNKYVPPLAHEGTQLWNTAVGWFEDHGSVKRNQTLAIQIQGTSEEGVIREPYMITIQHFTRAEIVGDIQADTARLNDIITTLHLENKRVMTELLEQSALERIGLTA